LLFQKKEVAIEFYPYGFIVHEQGVVDALMDIFDCFFSQGKKAAVGHPDGVAGGYQNGDGRDTHHSNKEFGGELHVFELFEHYSSLLSLDSGLKTAKLLVPGSISPGKKKC
jgi:hypothetical protein